VTHAVQPRENKGRRGWLDREPISLLREELDELINKFFEVSEVRLPFRASVPPLELSETNGEVRVQIDVPGMKPDDIDIEIVGNTLTVSGERKEEKEDKGRTYHRVERRSGEFSRSITLPCEVKEDSVDARYHDGVLVVVMQKTEATRSRKVPIKS
jgi:HSP20 family protein